MHLRYRATAAGTKTFTSQDLIGMVGAFAATTTSAYALSKAVRVKKVELWAPVQTAGTPVTASLDWNTGNVQLLVGPGSLVSDTSVSFDRPAHLVTSPPKDSLQQSWQSADNATPMFDLTVVSGTIVDFYLDFVLNDQGGAGFNFTIVAGTVGKIYHLITQTDYTIVSLNSI
jgi:hypothetical protein